MLWFMSSISESMGSSHTTCLHDMAVCVIAQWTADESQPLLVSLRLFFRLLPVQRLV